MAQSCFDQKVMREDYLDADNADKAYGPEQKAEPVKNSANISATLKGDNIVSDYHLEDADAIERADNSIEEIFSAEEDMKLEEIWRETCVQGLARKDTVVKFSWGRCDFHGHPFADRCRVSYISKLIDSIRSGYIYSLTELAVNFNLMQTTAQRSQLANLLAAVAPTVKVLSMYNIRYWRQPYLESTEFLALKNLELRFSKLEKHLEQKWAQDLILDFMHRAPALENLSLKGTKIMSHFLHIINAHNYQNVRRLFVSSEISNRDLLQMAGLGLQLKALCLEIYVSKTQKYPIKPGGMKKLLQSISAHLEELVLQGVRKSPQNVRLEIEFPKMPQLKTLGILMYCPFVEFRHFSLATQLPNLKILHLTLLDPDLSNTLFDDHVKPATSVESLAISWSMDASKLLYLAKQFPNLKKLAIEAAPKLLESLEYAFCNLEDLNLMFNLESGVDADSILTEYSRELGKKYKAGAEISKTFLPDEKRPMNILLDLKTLTLATSGESLGLTDIGCHMILQKFPRLRCLNLWGKHEVSESTIKLMREKITVS